MDLVWICITIPSYGIQHTVSVIIRSGIVCPYVGCCSLSYTGKTFSRGIYSAKNSSGLSCFQSICSLIIQSSVCRIKFPCGIQIIEIIHTAPHIPKLVIIRSAYTVTSVFVGSFPQSFIKCSFLYSHI